MDLKTIQRWLLAKGSKDILAGYTVSYTVAKRAKYQNLSLDNCYWLVGPRRPSDQSDAIVAGYLYM